MNVVIVSPKRHDQLRVAQANNVANLIADDQLVTGSGLNQIGTLQRAGDTRWGSHLNSVRSLLCMFDATCEVLEKSTEEGNFSTRGDANAAYDAITSFEFVFVLHLMRNILEVSHDLCQALQRKNQDILNALTLVSTTKTLIQRMRESSWEAFIKEVILFCEKHEVELQERNGRFNDNMVELLTLSSTLDPRDNYKFFSVNKVCELVERFYPGDFSDQEKFHIRMQAQHYELDVPNHVELTNLCTISELCQRLTKTGKSLTYPLIDRLIRLGMLDEQTCMIDSLAVSKYWFKQEHPDIASNQHLTFTLQSHMSLATEIVYSNEENGEAITISLLNIVLAQHDEKSFVFICPVKQSFYVY
ncbi:uncharacterized protein [Arachis hypogaea]|uniref:uncharacterized protein n=1 Tax=Arachis hypogaea TaxID=3818 RepID=UPI000DECA223|nr:uncharacterized protein LOC112727271 [Arachis hypogaea]